MQCLRFLLCTAAIKAKENQRGSNCLATHRDTINELLSAGPSNHQNELKSEPHTKDVGIQCGKYLTVCVRAVVQYICKSGSCTTELPILSRGPTHFVDLYPELVVQHDISTQADMFLACSSPKEPCTYTSFGR